MNVAVVLRKAQRRISIADEHDSEQIAAYCRDLGSETGGTYRVVLPAERQALDEIEAWDAILFVGADDFVRRFIEQADGRRPVFLWAKGYDLTIDPNWARALSAIRAFFNSSYLSAVEDRYNDRTYYVPTAFHNRWPQTVAGYLDDARNRFVDVAQYDVVFSGSDRHVRADRYRQLLLNLLVRRGLKVCVAAPRSAWDRAHQSSGQDPATLDRSIVVLGNWGNERIFHGARCVLDLPWLDNVFPVHPPHQQPNSTVFALGWNIFRAGAYGACVLTYDCAANRALGLSEDNCLFYTSDVRDLETLADDIAERVGRARETSQTPRKQNLKRLFHERHTYRKRWTEIGNEVARSLSQERRALTA